MQSSDAPRWTQSDVSQRGRGCGLTGIQAALYQSPQSLRRPSQGSRRVRKPAAGRWRAPNQERETRWTWEPWWSSGEKKEVTFSEPEAEVKERTVSSEVVVVGYDGVVVKNEGGIGCICTEFWSVVESPSPSQVSFIWHLFGFFFCLVHVLSHAFRLNYCPSASILVLIFDHQEPESFSRRCI